MLHGWGRRCALGVGPGAGLGAGWARVLFLASGWTWGFCCFWPPVALDFYFLGSVGLGNAENAVQLDLGVGALRDCAGKREVGASFAWRVYRAKSN